jgi:hypothetical protein
VHGQVLAECQVGDGIYIAVREDNGTISRSLVELVIEVLNQPCVSHRSVVPILPTFQWALTWAVDGDNGVLILVGGDPADVTALTMTLGPVTRQMVTRFLDAIARSGNVALTIHGLVREDGEDFEVTVPLYADRINIQGDVDGITTTVQTLRRRN